MQRRSPPKHRHDGTSPLPLGMDWSPPPKKWNGRDTLWPHDHRTGWSYCVTIPSWVVLPKSRDSDPVVFYRVQVGLQSPDGTTTTRMVLRRFNDFLKLYAELKRAFPKKNLPAAPAKGLFRMKSRALLDERKCSLEEWMTKLLSDIDLSRSFAVAAFLELEASARSSFEDPKRNTSEAEGSENSAVASLQAHPDSSFSVLAGGSSITSDYGSDTPYETSDLGTPRFRRDDSSETGLEDLALDDDLANPLEKLVKYGVSNIDEGLFMGQAILEQLEGFPRHKALDSQVNEANGRNKENGIASEVSFLTGNDLELFSEPDHIKVTGHVRKLSADSVGSDVSSARGSEMSNSGIPNLSGNGSFYFPGGETSSSVDNLGSTELKIPEDSQLMLPLDQRHKLHRVLFTMQRRLVTAKTDMEDLIGRLNQESAVKDYLTTKVKDLEAELESTKLKSKENLQQAILAEREMLTQMQWDMEELRRKSYEMELKLKAKEGEKSTTEPTEESTSEDKHVILQELDATKEQLCNLQKRYEELEARSKADVKVLVKEVKSLRSSQTRLKEELTQSLEEKTKFEKLYQEEIEMKRSSKASWEKLLQECEVLYKLLQQCNISFNIDNSKVSVDSSSPAETMKLLTDSDDQIALVTTQASALAQDKSNERDGVVKDDTRILHVMLRKMLADIITDSAGSRKQLNSVLHLSMDTGHHLEKGEEAPS